MKNTTHYAVSAKALCALSLMFAATASNADTNDPKFTMTLFADNAQGSSILEGQYKDAIKKINAKSAKSFRFETETNLCVAYTKSGALQQATAACEAAVQVAQERKAKRGAGRGIGGSSDRNRSLAIALSNRGVLKAVMGDYDAARRDFDTAVDLRARIDAPKTNLQRLSIAEGERA